MVGIRVTGSGSGATPPGISGPAAGGGAARPGASSGGGGPRDGGFGYGTGGDNSAWANMAPPTNAVQAALAAHAAANAAASAAGVGGWGRSSGDGSGGSGLRNYPGPTYGGMSGMRANAGAENANRDFIERRMRREAVDMNRDRELAAARDRRLEFEMRREAIEINRDRDLASARDRRNYGSMRQEAESMNRDFNLAQRSTRASADYDNGVFDRNRAAADANMRAPHGAYGRLSGPDAGDRWGGGSSDGGSGGGGGGGRGRGGGRGFGQAAAGSMGFGATAGVLAGAGEAPGSLYFEALKEIIFAPQMISRLEGAWLGRSEQFRSHLTNASQMGQAGGFSGTEMMGRLSGDQLLSSGIGPDEAMRMVRSLGVAPRSAGQGARMGMEMANSRTAAGLSMIPPEMHAEMLRNMMSVGATSPDHLTSADTTIKSIMMKTAETGQVQLQVLQSIDRGVVNLSTSPGASAAIDPGALFNYNQRFITTPGGRAGVAGERDIGSIQSALASTGSDPAHMIIASQFSEQNPDEKSLASLFAKSNGGAAAWNKFSKSATGRGLIDTYTKTKAGGDGFAAARILAEGIMADPGLVATGVPANMYANSPLTNVGSSGMTLIGQANVSHRSLTEQMAYNQSQQKGQAPGETARNPLNLMYAKQPGAETYTLGTGEVLASFQSNAEGVAANINQLRMDQNKGFLTVRQHAMHWTAGHASAAYIKGTADALGVGPDTPVDMNNPANAAAYIRGAQPFETGPGRTDPADIASGTALAFGQKNPNPNFRPDGEADPNLPNFNPAVARAKRDVLLGSEITTREGELAINTGHFAIDAMGSSVAGGFHMIAEAVANLLSAVRSAETHASAPSNAPS